MLSNSDSIEAFGGKHCRTLTAIRTQNPDYGRGAGVGRGLGVGEHLPLQGVGDGVAVGVADGVGVGVGPPVGYCVTKNRGSVPRGPTRIRS